jgi:hypothetical protein
LHVARGTNRRRWELKQLRDGGSSIRSGGGGGGGGGGGRWAAAAAGQERGVGGGMGSRTRSRGAAAMTDKTRLTENQYKNALKKKRRPLIRGTPPPQCYTIAPISEQRRAGESEAMLVKRQS